MKIASVIVNNIVSCFCLAVSLKLAALQDALVNLIRRARPVFLQCVHARSDGGSFDVPMLRVQLQSTQILPALQFHRTGLVLRYQA